MPLIPVFGVRQAGLCEGRSQLVYSKTQDSENYKETMSGEKKKRREQLYLENKRKYYMCSLLSTK
jgi:hypothetical protein